MKMVCVIRHGKSSWNDTSLPDRERPLLPVGLDRTMAVSLFIREHGLRFDLIISSPARRALQTAEIVARETAYPLSSIQVEEGMYHAGPERIVDTLLGISDEVESVALFGHNPGMTYFVNEYLGIRTDNFPTSAVACFSVPTASWSDLPLAKPETRFFITPKDLRN